ncbi:Probable cytosolic Fe-S cluster assembly factor C806.02c [Taphrina deformans PYCC 5710]|uniref:Probable cytosolic iron-sulfur protein assembly protein 1 n=1 Tax=Taphrina deformans (strain PYCC 5710 / ATCC 11124 / CBS 356.35 / IMI 108563 / JCM 9778 / NBRC 8474) TaxID=1097556 RepID=R4XCF7_TAPDE|nr:Probable cytosolic Fe-S cluster assembly factor C806.02c [Taphrina deformans PYCC 5710]|eukprot:CCG83276.1 Probable cytosolic Fe-S cluster assembly factor C806.02c [Taphrina deformans PYCC 5710]
MISTSTDLEPVNGKDKLAELASPAESHDASNSSDIITHKHTLGGHTDRVWNVSIHPTIPLIATASADKTVRLYSAKSFQQVGLIEGNHKRSIRSCAWKPGEPKPVLATASFDGTAGIWDSQTDEDTQETEWECAGLLEGHENEVKSVAWSASGTLLATCSRDKSIWIWECENYEDPECVSVMQEHSQDVKCVVWHPSEELLASGSYDDEIRIWRDDGDDWICCSILKGHEGTVWSVDFAESKGDRPARLVSASGDSTVRVWTRTADPASVAKDNDAVPSIIRPDQNQVWEETVVLPSSHLGDIYTVAWSKKSNRIASAGEDGNITIYSSQPATDGDTAEKWKIVAQKISAHGVHEINHLAWGAVTAEGSELLFSAGDDGVTNVWNVSSK